MSRYPYIVINIDYFICRMKKKQALLPEGYRDRAAERRANGEGAPEDEETTMTVGLHNMPPPSEE